MKRLKDFFSPIKGGNHRGTTWWSFYLKLENAGLQVGWLIISTLIGFCMEPSSFELGEEFWYYILLGFSVCINIIIFIVSLTFWSRLKH